MTYKDALRIAQHLTSLGIKAEMMTDYSGRFMYGQTTAGVIVDSPGSVGVAASHLNIDNDFRWDQLGLQSIVY